MPDSIGVATAEVFVLLPANGKRHQRHVLGRSRQSAGERNTETDAIQIKSDAKFATLIAIGCVLNHALAGMSKSPLFCHRIWHSRRPLTQPKPLPRNSSASVGEVCSVIVTTISEPYYGFQNCC